MTSTRQTSILAAGALALSFLAPCLASADAPNRLVGTLTDFHGKYVLDVRDERGRLNTVTLHPGTIITPTGLRLERGMKVAILGQTAGRTFAAGEIDTAYNLPPPRDGKHAGTDAGPTGQRAANPADNARFGDFPGDRNATRVTEPRTAVPPR